MSTTPGSARPEALGIGELAARTGRTVHAIRWYEAQGLIPGVVRDPGGRRRYSERVKRTIAGWNEALALLERKLDFYDDLIRKKKTGA